MATPVESANLILKLYELRREETMRKARDFFFTFDPKSADDYMKAMMGPHSSYLRMVASYWEMAASLVVNGAIDAKMFDETQGEHIMVFSKLEPILPQLREIIGSPNAFKNLEKVCTSAEGGIERVRATRERIRQIMAAAASTATA
jgi:hypothetical protein